MPETKIDIQWDQVSREKYETMIRSIPMFHREIARQVVDKKAVINAQDRSSETVEDEDIIRAFLTEVPGAFYSLMVRLMDQAGFDYQRYETE